jgi:hypothetical protein
MDMTCTISRDMPQEDILRKKVSYGIWRYWRCSISKKCSKGVATRIVVHFAAMTSVAYSYEHPSRSP